MAYVLLLENFGKKICSKQVVECDCKFPSLLPLIPVQSSRKRAQNNIATNPGEFQKLGTKRYQSDNLSFEFKITVLESLILNSSTKSGSPAVLCERFPSECIRSICVGGAALSRSQPRHCEARPGHWGVTECARLLLLLLCSATGQGSHWVLSASGAAARGSPEHAEGKGALSVQSWASSAVSLLLLLPFPPSQSVILAPQSNCHTVNLLSPLLQLGSATEWMDCFQKSIAIWEHISFLCAGSWVKKNPDT